ncbi:hypothetical protein [Chthoniobacter flavus]|nr:hypothetical protein [Chthoniobacter flavus]
MKDEERRHPKRGRHIQSRGAHFTSSFIPPPSSFSSFRGQKLLLSGFRDTLSGLICRGNHYLYIQSRLFRRFPRMPETPKEEIKNIQEEIGALVKRTLIQTGDIQDVEEKLKGIVERSSRITPPPAESANTITPPPAESADS